MAKDIVTNRQLYEAIEKVHRSIDELAEQRIKPLEMWKAEITGKIAVLGLLAITGVTLMVDWIKAKIFKI